MKILETRYSDELSQNAKTSFWSSFWRPWRQKFWWTSSPQILEELKWLSAEVLTTEVLMNTTRLQIQVWRLRNEVSYGQKFWKTEALKFWWNKIEESRLKTKAVKGRTSNEESLEDRTWKNTPSHWWSKFWRSRDQGSEEQKFWRTYSTDWIQKIRIRKERWNPTKLRWSSNWLSQRTTHKWQAIISGSWKAKC